MMKTLATLIARIKSADTFDAQMIAEDRLARAMGFQGLRAVRDGSIVYVRDNGEIKVYTNIPEASDVEVQESSPLPATPLDTNLPC